jgi:hypothetical protein
MSEAITPANAAETAKRLIERPSIMWTSEGRRILVALVARVKELESERDEFRARLMRFEGSVDSARGDTAEMAEIAHGLEQQRDAAVAILREDEKYMQAGGFAHQKGAVRAALAALGSEESK